MYGETIDICIVLCRQCTVLCGQYLCMHLHIKTPPISTTVETLHTCMIYTGRIALCILVTHVCVHVYKNVRAYVYMYSCIYVRVYVCTLCTCVYRQHTCSAETLCFVSWWCTYVPLPSYVVYAYMSVTRVYRQIDR